MTTKKKNILIFIDWFLPGYKAGGPIKSVSNIVSSLHDSFNFHIITSDRDIGDSKPYPSEELNKWVKKDNYNIAFLTEESRKNFITKAISTGDFDSYYFNSLYSKNYTIEPFRIIKKLKTNPRIVIAPRGMLGKGALKIKPLKKKLFLKATKTTGFFKNVIWHATDKEEVNDINLIFGNNVKTFQVPNISIIKIEKFELSKEKNELKLVFFSRISPKKNLFYALEILSTLNNPNVSMDIYGTVEDAEYWDKCQKHISNHGIKVNYIGQLNPTNVQETLSKYHFCFFPTLHENFGHVIVEALTAGCGLIISTNTPWRNLNRSSIGWDIDLNNKEAFIDAINTCLAMSQEEYDTYRNNSYQFIINETNKQNAIDLTKKMFLE